VQLKPNAPDNTVATLSGGNQQKVILGRWLSVERPLLVLEEPTMGVDVGARAEIYGLIESAAAAGLAVLVVSSDFEELETLCHRVLVMDRGGLAAELSGDEVTQNAILRAASGTRASQGALT
jgi:ribose transport system ATP-binding protein